MKKFEILEHKADLKIRSFGRTKEELFQNMLLGMQESMKPELKTPGEETKREIKVKSLDWLALLVDFLSEVLYLTQINKEIYSDVKFKKFSGSELEAELFGKKVERFGEDIKAVTYHNLEINQRPERSKGGRKTNVLRPKDGSWEAIVLFDI